MGKSDSNTVKRDSNTVIDKFVGPARNDTERDARTTGWALAWTLLFGLIFAASWRPTSWPVTCMWSGACALVGMLLGFLFGIPRFIARAGVPSTKSVSSDQAGGQGGDATANQAGQAVGAGGGQQAVQAVGAGAGQQVGQAVGAGAGQQTGQAVGTGTGQQAGQAGGAGFSQPTSPGQSISTSAGQQLQAGVNTNLEEISDWLTKIIVGVSLVELNKAQVKLQQVAGFIAESLGGSAQASFAYGLMVYFSVAGFLGSYLLTRLYLQKAFRDAAGDL